MIKQQEYHARRKKLAQQLPKGSIAIIPAAHEVIRNGDAHFRFRQDSNFYYLTGYNEPEAVLVISGAKESQSILFNRERNPQQEQWTGTRLGQDGAVSELAMDSAYPITSFSEQLPKLLDGKSAVYYLLGHNTDLEQKIVDAINSIKNQVRAGAKAPEALCDLEPILSEQRVIKSEAEIELMRQAARISVDAHKRAMRRCKQLENEYELEAELVYEFTRQGCRSVAYDPIVGSGENACILHYTANNKVLDKDALVLIDAGCEYHCYAADITRTFPVNGRFSSEQKKIYELVLKAQKAGIEKVRPGVLWNEVQKEIVQVLTAGLCSMGLLKGKQEHLIADEAYKSFYMHNSGHWLGLDVHDCGRYKINNEWRALEAGMVLTVEPGLYISPGMTEVDQRWWGIGVRIEDDVLVTDEGHEVLTAALPVDVDEIEALMSDE